MVEQVAHRKEGNQKPKCRFHRLFITDRLHVIEKPRLERFLNADKLPGFLEYATCYKLHGQTSPAFINCTNVVLIFLALGYLD